MTEAFLRTSMRCMAGQQLQVVLLPQSSLSRVWTCTCPANAMQGVVSNPCLHDLISGKIHLQLFIRVVAAEHIVIASFLSQA